jgi:hypothetical protein
MTPEQRLDRAERMLLLFVRAGRRSRKVSREQDQRISIIIKTQMETEEIIKGLALGQARINQEMAELAKSQRLTDQALRAFINTSRSGENGSP